MLFHYIHACTFSLDILVFCLTAHCSKIFSQNFLHPFSVYIILLSLYMRTFYYYYYYTIQLFCSILLSCPYQANLSTNISTCFINMKVLSVHFVKKPETAHSVNSAYRHEDNVQKTSKQRFHSIRHLLLRTVNSKHFRLLPPTLTSENLVTHVKQHSDNITHPVI